MRSDGNSHHHRRTITLIPRCDFYFGLLTSLMVISLIFSFLDPDFPTKEQLDMLSRIMLSFILLICGCVPIKKFRTARYQIIRYLRHYCFWSITLSPSYGISLNLTFIVGLISLVFTVPTSRVSLAERSVMMLITGSAILLLELLPLYMEKSLGYRILRSDYIFSSTITLSRRYKLSLSFRSIPFAILLILRVRMPDVSLARISPFILLSVYPVFFFDSFCTYMRRYTDWLALYSYIELDSNDCSELPPEVVHEIVNRLLTFKDFIAAAGVSRTWRSVCLSISRRPQLPWLMLSETLSTEMRHFFSLCDNNRYQLLLSEVQGKRCWGSPHGWIVTLGSDYETHLLHLMKRVQIALPPLNTIRRLAAVEEWFRLVHKFILLKDPSHELSFLVIAIFGPVNRLAFARVAFDKGGEGAALNSQGQWAIVTSPDNLKFNDVECFNDQIYGICDNGNLVCLELDAPLAAEVLVIAPQPSEEEVGTPQKLYLMKSSENLFAVFRYRFPIPSEMRHETRYFLVYKFNFGELAWEEVTDDSEDISFFVGGGNSWCIPTSAILCRSNCIYFTDDNWERERYPGAAYGGHDVGVFNMAQRVIQRLPFGKDNPLFYSRPIWVTPTMRLDELFVR